MAHNDTNSSAATTVVCVAGRPADLRVRQIHLHVQSGPDAPAEFAHNARELSIGSHPSNHLVLGDSSVSRFHLRIVATETGFRVLDKKSTNGTFVNGVRVHDGYLLDGAQLRVGNSLIGVRFGETETRVDLAETDNFGAALGGSVGMREIFAIAERAAATTATVLLLGETGTGKDVLAHEIHEHSSRATHPFVVFDCAAAPPNLIESELFGHVRGAFTGAERNHAGVFQRATSGTLFLDEIGELPLSLQAKLLRALDSRVITPVGGSQPIAVDVRVIAATNRDLRDMVARELFRSDLYYRLAVIPIEIPPLRDRSEDIPSLAAHFLEHIVARDGHKGNWLRQHLERAFAGLAHYRWPGNVRELQNVIERAVAFADPAELAKDPFLQLVELRSRMARAIKSPGPLATAREQFDRQYLRDALAAAHGTIKTAAVTAGIHPKSFERLLRRYGIARR